LHVQKRYQLKKIDLLNITSSEEQLGRKKLEIQKDLEKIEMLYENLQRTAKIHVNASVLTLRVSRCRHKIDELHRDFNKHAHVPGNAAKNSNHSVQSIESQNQSQRIHLLEGHQNIAYMSNALTTTHSIALDTERIGEEALKDLAVHRGMIEGGINDLDNVGNQVDSVRSRLSTMGRRLITDKVILIIVIVLLLAAIGAVVFVKWILPIIRKNEHPAQ